MADPWGCTSLKREDTNPDCPWHGYLPCKNCGEKTWEGGGAHYVPALFHDTPPEDAIEPYYTCEKSKRQ